MTDTDAMTPTTDADERVLEAVAAAFAAVPRPEHFTNYQHCCECAEHDATLASRNLATLTHDDVGAQSWDPICFATEDAFGYYFPALARLALGPEHDSWGWYGEQLIRHLELTARITAAGRPSPAPSATPSACSSNTSSIPAAISSPPMTASTTSTASSKSGETTARQPKRTRNRHPLTS